VKRSDGTTTEYRVWAETMSNKRQNRSKQLEICISQDDSGI
jgi:hypothetical protein